MLNDLICFHFPYLSFFTQVNYVHRSFAEFIVRSLNQNCSTWKIHEKLLPTRLVLKSTSMIMIVSATANDFKFVGSSEGSKTFRCCALHKYLRLL